MRQRWRASWIDASGKPIEFIFDSINNRMIAGIDLRLKSQYAGFRIPEKFELEEVHYAGETAMGGNLSYRGTTRLS